LLRAIRKAQEYYLQRLASASDSKSTSKNSKTPKEKPSRQPSARTAPKAPTALAELPPTQAAYPFLAFVEGEHGWTLMDIGCDRQGHVLFSRKETDGMYRGQDKEKGVVQYVQHFYPKSRVEADLWDGAQKRMVNSRTWTRPDDDDAVIPASKLRLRNTIK
jgi:hypothetical protein